MIQEEQLGGYDYQFLEPGPSDDQKCPICHLVVRNAYQVNCCGKIMCEGCLMTHMRGSRSCPLCRDYIGYKYFKDTKSDREIKSLMTYCSSKDAGCKWKGELKYVEVHLDECLYQDIECENCDKTLLKLCLQEHMLLECPMRIHKCHLCNEEGPYQTITTTHKLTCPEVQVKCRNAGCNRRLRRSKMSSHAASCPKQAVQCPFNHMGCEFNSKREDLPIHIEGEMGSHLNLVAEQVKSQAYNRSIPIVLKFSSFSNALKHSKAMYSEGFYTGVGGYKLQLFVHPLSDYQDSSPHLSVFICLMSGLNDDSVEWPLQGKFSITLLNQLQDNCHHVMSVNFNDKTPSNIACRQREGVSEEGWGRNNFLPHSGLGLDTSSNTQYLKNDILYFRVDGKIYSNTKPWLAIQ